MTSESDNKALQALLRRVVPKTIREAQAYEKNNAGAHPIVARLDANEAPYPFSQVAWQRALRALGTHSAHRYPHLDDIVDGLVTQLSDLWLGQKANRSRKWMFGVGSDELITLLLATFCASSDRPPSILVPTPTFSMYALSARLRGFLVHEVPLAKSFSLDVARMTQAIAKEKPNLVFLASPNNPTGNAFADSDLQAIVRATEKANSLLVIDEAYVYYSDAGSRFQKLCAPHVIFMSTLSKVGMAGLRLGFMNLEKPLAQEVDKLRLPYNVPMPSALLAQSLLQAGNAELSRNIERVRKGKLDLARIAHKHGLIPLQSDSNVVLMETPISGTDCAHALRKQGVLVRSFSAPRLTNHIRINVGTPTEHRALDAALGKIPGSARRKLS